MASRREFLQALAASLFAVSTGLPAVARQRDSLKAMFEDASAEEPPWALLQPLQAGNNIGKGWRIASLSKVERGASVLALEHHDGRGVRIHLCAAKGAPIGVAHSDSIDLLLMDGSPGNKQTEEDLGRVLKALAHRISINERELGRDAAAFLARLESHADRVATYGPEALV